VQHIPRILNQRYLCGTRGLPRRGPGVREHSLSPMLKQLLSFIKFEAFGGSKHLHSPDIMRADGQLEVEIETCRHNVAGRDIVNHCPQMSGADGGQAVATCLESSSTLQTSGC
jgi:hypothetical protein